MKSMNGVSIFKVMSLPPKNHVVAVTLIDYKTKNALSLSSKLLDKSEAENLKKVILENFEDIEGA